MSSIGIIGYGFVGQAVANGFLCEKHICDPVHNNTTIQQLVENTPVCIFVCVPTPQEDTPDISMRVVVEVVDQLKSHNYTGVILVKSTVLPKTFDESVVCNPEFLSRKTAHSDFTDPPLLLLGGDRAQEALEIYKTYSKIDPLVKTVITDNTTACLIKYTMNCFYATKLCYMNQIHTLAEQTGADYEVVVQACKMQPWMGTHHFDVPGPDGKKGFGGPCLPKDIDIMSKKYELELFELVGRINQNQRNNSCQPTKKM